MCNGHCTKCAILKRMNVRSVEMKVIQDKYEKKKIQTLPCVHFEGRIIVIFTERDDEKAVDFLMRQKVLGLDTEKWALLKKGKGRWEAWL